MRMGYCSSYVCSTDLYATQPWTRAFVPSRTRKKGANVMMKAMPVGSADRSRGALVRIGQCGLAAALLCLSAPGHAEPGPELIEAAEGEGELTAYIALANEVAQAWFEDFSEKYGIEVPTYRASTATVSRRD